MLGADILLDFLAVKTVTKISSFKIVSPCTYKATCYMIGYIYVNEDLWN